MPQSVLSADRVLSMLPKPLGAEELEEILFASKAELTGWTDDALTVEVTPDRLDLLSEGGLGVYLQGATRATHGGVPIRWAPPDEPPLTFEVDPSVAPVRPEIAGVVVRAPDDAPLDAGLLAEAIRFQELLHATVGLDRRLSSLGIYPADRIRRPVRYSLESIDQVRFVPLAEREEVGARDFLARHPLAARYAAYGTRGDQLLTLRDRGGEVLSVPPILNTATAGEAKAGDSALLLESTGIRRSSVEQGLGLLLLVFVARGWSVTPVPVRTAEGLDDGARTVAPREIELPGVLLTEVSGRAYSAAEVGQLFGQVRMSARTHPHGWTVEVPAWRPDVLTSTDLVEEILLARGVRAEEGIFPPSPTRGRLLPEVRFRRRVGELLRGLGYTELHTPVLVSAEAVRRLGRTGSLEVTNPVSDQFQYLRDALQPSLVASLERNVRFGYPQRFAEVGPIVVRDPASETGGTTRHRAGVLLAAERAGFADAAALVDYLTGAFGAVGVREPVQLPGTIPGRAARVRLAGEAVGELGELHPDLLTAVRVPVPVAWAEVDLTALYPLVRRETDK